MTIPSGEPLNFAERDTLGQENSNGETSIISTSQDGDSWLRHALRGHSDGRIFAANVFYPPMTVAHIAAKEGEWRVHN